MLKGCPDFCVIGEGRDEFKRSTDQPVKTIAADRDVSGARDFGNLLAVNGERYSLAS